VLRQQYDAGTMANDGTSGTVRRRAQPPGPLCCNKPHWPLGVLIIKLFIYTLITHTPTQLFYDPFSGTIQASRCPKNLLDFMLQEKIREADTPTIRLGATPSY